MCGIAGIISKDRSADSDAQLRHAAQRLTHRGPEAERFWTNEEKTVLLGHHRLCIIDLSEAAAQPMRYHNRYVLVYNGEIYNYQELRTALEKAGAVFRSQSDTEVLLAAYVAWGEDCLQRFDGAFAFALWDEVEQTLFAARDRTGEKPFFFSYNGERLVFASEIKALWAMGIEKDINHRLLYNFLTLGYTNNPGDAEETFYNGVYKLPAAHSLTYSLPKNELRTRCYWQVYAEEDNRISEPEAVETFRYLFAQSLRRRLRSDVPVGTSLSGGLDSSAVVAFCAGETAAQYTHKCFTASFAGFEKDETVYAAQVAQRFGLQHFTTTVSAEEVPDLMDAVAAQQDEPFSSSSALAQYKVFALAKEQGVTVLLDGQGADELLAGYYRYYRLYWQQLYANRKLKRSGELQAARALGIGEAFTYQHKIAALFPDFTASLLQTKKSKNAFRHPDLNRDFAFQNKQNLYYTTPLRPTLNSALHYNTFVNGLEELLRLADRNSMAHSVEVRLPFLSHELIEFLFTLPPQFKIQKGWTKWLLRKATEEKLPADIVWRKDKVGYETPQKSWMQDKAVQERMMQARETLVKNGVLNKAVLTKGIVPKNAHEEASFDWRYWSAAALYK